jgi:osmoprotectant transport system permease protein
VSLVVATAAWLTDPANWSGPNGIPVRLGEHVEISLASLAIALAIGLPAGLYVGHTRRGSGVAIGLAGIARAVPSLALMGLVLPITQAFDPANGFSLYPTVFAMVALAIPPILVNAYAGIRGVDAEIVEAARGVGLTERQILGRIEVPLGLPVVLGGVRSASIQVIATAALGSLFALGGLGRYIVDGIAQNDDAMLFGGVVLVATLAMGSEGLLAGMQWYATRASRQQAPEGRRTGDAGDALARGLSTRPWWDA